MGVAVPTDLGSAIRTADLSTVRGLVRAHGRNPLLNALQHPSHAPSCRLAGGDDSTGGRLPIMGGGATCPLDPDPRRRVALICRLLRRRGPRLQDCRGGQGAGGRDLAKRPAGSASCV